MVACQSWGPWWNNKFQLLPPSEFDTTKLETHTSLKTEQLYMEGKSFFKGVGPHHGSCQKLTRLPSPTLNKIWLKNFSVSSLILLHIPHPWAPLTPLVHQPPLASPYLSAITWRHNRWFSIPNCHNHFLSKALLNSPTLQIPKPPHSTSKHTLSQATKGYLKTSSEAPPKEIRLNSFNSYNHSLRDSKQR